MSCRTLSLLSRLCVSCICLAWTQQSMLLLGHGCPSCQESCFNMSCADVFNCRLALIILSMYLGISNDTERHKRWGLMTKLLVVWDTTVDPQRHVSSLSSMTQLPLNHLRIWTTQLVGFLDTTFDLVRRRCWYFSIYLFASFGFFVDVW